ncbi:WD40 repeat domain-containing protein [Aspergillus stella-maris]|uniref:WD40 repeat domain-containing protein n=1 Tax=Aspergillus stella-maris TaxID=1810926 RepID=UPI003CCCD425
MMAGGQVEGHSHGHGHGRGSVSRASTTIPAITTNNDSFVDESSPLSPVRSGLPRSSQSFVIASDGASGSSGNLQQDARKSLQRAALQGSGSGLVGRNSLTSPVAFESADSSAIDPLSQHIIKRTNTQKSIPLRLLGRASYEAEAGGSDKYSPVEQSSGRDQAPQKPKEKKKGVSFLSRIIPGKKKEEFSDEEDNASEMGNARNEAPVAAQPVGFFPRFPPPPKYARVRAHYKKDKTFNRVFQAQTLEGVDAALGDDERPGTAESGSSKSTGKAIWALVFSKDGKYLAAAGQDKKVRVWSVIGSPEDRDASESENDDEDMHRLKAPVFKETPIQVYESHTGSILDLSWSKNNFLLSSSMDKTVRLWHVSRPECLCCFKHSDFVTSIQFHPRDDRFFLAGSLDMKLRLWSIPDKSVAFTVTVPDMITSVAFTPDGRYSMAGCLNGMLNIYETDGLKPAGNIHVRSARGRNAKGSKITGIDSMFLPKDDAEGALKLLITSNDSRIRLYDFRDRTLEAKFRGNENTCSQIRATFSDDGKHIICGSEDRRAYIWPMGPVEKDADKRAFEVLDTQSSMVTAAIMAPNVTKQVLSLSEDPIYDICNPPPVTLESNANKESNRQNRISMASKLAQESPGFISRSTHPDGHIICAADYSGRVKIFRQDCAYHKRRYDSWDTHSTISRRLLRRSNSARHSIASSIGKESSHKTPSERIISWRNSVIGHDNASTKSQRQPRTRSSSPNKAMAAASRNASPERGSAGARAEAESRSAFTTSPPPSGYKSSFSSPRSSFAERRKQNGNRNGGGPKPEEREPEPRRSLHHPTSAAELINKGGDQENPLWLAGDHSYAFYNKITQDALAVHRNSPGLLDPNSARPNGPERRPTRASILSSEYASSNASGEDNDVLRCDSCWGTNFKATKGRSGKQRLICVRCSKPITESPEE